MPGTEKKKKKKWQFFLQRTLNVLLKRMLRRCHEPIKGLKISGIRSNRSRNMRRPA